MVLNRTFALGVVLGSIIMGCEQRSPRVPGTTSSSRPTKANQQSPSTSPSGKWILTVPIERDPSDRNLPFWRVTITDSGGKQVFKDDSKLIGTLSVYWIWDNEDRIWLWNSDDGTTYYWQFDETSWSRRQHRGGTLKPPEALYPEYLKRM